MTKNSEYDQEIRKSQTADQPVALRVRDTQQSQDTRTTKQSLFKLCPWDQMGPPWGYMFYIDLYRENLNKSSCLKQQGLQP